MAVVSIKAVVLNSVALTAKYGAAGAATITAALGRMVASDKGRGLDTIVFDLADAGQMAGIKAAAVVGPTDERGAKAAVDAIHAAHMPDYIMLLDGPDVVPHIALRHIAGIDDEDTTTDSDLPYASPAAFSPQAAAYLAVTRVVGRLPAARGETDAGKLVALIDAAIAQAGAKGDLGSTPFAITAQKWTASTQLSLANIFGSHSALVMSPLAGHPTIDAGLAQGAHFINCHGARGDWRFYGEQEGAFPVAMESPAVSAATIAGGAVVAAECCYGAELYNYRMLAAPPPLCLTYLWKGACAVMGSTNIAYGPAAGNGQADYMAQYFLQEVFAGASTGRAMLQARQNFVLNQTMSNPFNLKTLAQFLLLGDPSLHPVRAEKVLAAPGAPETAPPPKGAPEALDTASEVRMRRFWLDSEGKSAASSASKPGPRAKRPSPGVKQFIEAARKNGFKAKPQVFTVGGGATFRATAKAFNQERQVAVVMEQWPCIDEKGRALFVSTRAIVGHMLGNGVFMIEECERR
jgi:hypothetical protein